MYFSSLYNKTNVFNIGAPNPCSLYETFEFLIQEASNKSKIYSLPSRLILPLMKLFFKIGLSPLGPYQYNMIINSFSGNTDLIHKAGNQQKITTKCFCLRINTM